MDRRERDEDPEEMLRAAFDGLQAKLWTSMPGIVQSFDPTAMTAVVQPAIRANIRAKDGTTKLVDLPLLVDCPVQFVGGGGVTLTFPVKQGDECLVVFGSRGIDFWWQSGSVQPPAESRMHDLSDGFVLLGVRSKPRVLANFSTTCAELRSDDGATFICLDPEAQTITCTAPDGFTINADTTINGDAAISGDLSVGGSAAMHDGTFHDLTVTGNLTVASLAG